MVLGEIALEKTAIKQAIEKRAARVRRSPSCGGRSTTDQAARVPGPNSDAMKSICDDRRTAVGRQTTSPFLSAGKAASARSSWRGAIHDRLRATEPGRSSK